MDYIDTLSHEASRTGLVVESLYTAMFGLTKSTRGSERCP